MTWPTHTLFGISTLWLLAPLPPEVLGVNMAVLATAAAFGALLPDLDASESKIKHLKIPGTHIKPFMLPALIVSRSDQHRGLMHSLVGWGMVTVCAFSISPLVGWAPVVAFSLGYASHLFADACTKSGIRLFYPRKEWFYALPKGCRFTTGSIAEECLLPPLAGMVFLLLFTTSH